ncbi:MAG: TFIIB-type zinc ribbon-containing protein [Clostridiales bacterium]|nr:TFIIB-type zinc ribbon-containing protein [Clostridiales bacterium]
MAVVAYKCPNCGAPLEFSPGSQKFECAYCGAAFTEEELLAVQPETGEETTAPAGSVSGTGEAGEDQQVSLYICPSCGAQIVTDPTTAATSCLYCHSPVVLEGRLQGEFHPDLVIPFAFDREEAQRRFFDWVKKKRYIPKGYFDSGRTEYFMGVYYPYWVLDCGSRTGYEARANRVRIWRAGKREYTETKIYRILRDGDIHFEDLTRCALSGEGNELADSVMPFEVTKAVPFQMPYLSGFRAEMRNIEQEVIAPTFRSDVENYSKQIMDETVRGYDSVYDQRIGVVIRDTDYKYSLFPVWAFTYQGADGKKYFYAMNGQTGKTAGVLPLDRSKLLRDCAALFAGITGFIALLGGLMG